MQLTSRPCWFDQRLSRRLHGRSFTDIIASRGASSDGATGGRRSEEAADNFFAFIGWLMLVGLVYYRTQSTFLRAESGWYELVSHSDGANRAEFVHLMFTRSYHGHYTPIAFCLEAKITGIVGPSAEFWKWRQIAVTALLGAAMSYVTWSAGVASGISTWRAGAAATAVPGVLILQPAMREFIAWPFMVMQLGWALLSVCSLASLLHVACHINRRRWIWLTAACAYASMHILGQGILTVAAAAVGLTLVCLARWHDPAVQLATRRHIGGAIAIMLSFALAHGACMILLLDRHRQVADVSPHNSVATAIAFTAHFLARETAGLLNPQFCGAVTRLVSPAALASGAVLIAGGFSLLAAVAIRAYRRPTSERIVTAVLHSFTIIIFLGAIALMFARQQSGDPAASSLNGFLIGSRYLVAISFAFLGSTTAITLSVVRHLGRFAAICCCVLIIVSVAANLRYFASGYRTANPLNTISHRRVWKLIVATSAESSAAKMPVPNVPLGSLLQEFHDWDLRLFEPLLRAQLLIAESEPLPFASWERFRVVPPDEYRGAVPSLPSLIREIEQR